MYTGKIPQMDHCPIHHVENLSERVREAGALLMFLPKYSPNCNPIKNALQMLFSS